MREREREDSSNERVGHEHDCNNITTAAEDAVNFLNDPNSVGRECNCVRSSLTRPTFSASYSNTNLACLIILTVHEYMGKRLHIS